MSKRFAEGTAVPVSRTRDEIESTLKRFGADRFAYFSEAGKAVIVFEARDRRLRFSLPLPETLPNKRNVEQAHRERWRALLLAIKAKLSSVETGIESFESAFLANIVLPDGQTVGDHSLPRVAALYKGEPMQPLLPAPKRGAS